MTFDVEALQRLPEQNPSAGGLQPPATTTLFTCGTYVTEVTAK
ncbi:ALQxL family class IV lanthipeptide [Sphaerisporangium album]|nr:ALQxL family class IV lanthipeptide [Sphaerisporangium album]